MGKVDVNSKKHTDAVHTLKKIWQVDTTLPKYESIHHCQVTNHHLVVFLDSSPVEARKTLQDKVTATTLLENYNIHFVQTKDLSDNDTRKSKQIIGRKIEDLLNIASLERGSHTTNACGTGACAATTLVKESGFLAEGDWAAVDSPGGRVYVKLSSEACVNLTGPATFVFSGRFNL